MYRVVIEHVNPIEAIELKNQLLTAELIINKDFVWEYRQAVYDNDGFSAVFPKLVIFKFTDASLATFYQLKWAR